MKSIQRHLVASQLATVLGIAAVVGLFLYVHARERLIEGFDDALTAKAQAVEGMIVRQPDGGFELNPLLNAMPEFRAKKHTAYYEAWVADGEVIAKSPSLRGHDLARLPMPSGANRIQNIQLPSGDSTARAVTLRFVPALDADDETASHSPPLPRRIPAPVAVMLVVAQDRHDLDKTLWMFGSSLLLGAAFLAIGTVISIILTVRQGLHPLRRLASEANRIDAGSLHYRFPTAGVPMELLPIYATLNGLLTRLNDAFTRQRRFTADAAHELRTPIAELRAMAEVALKWPEDASPRQNYLDALAIADQMERLVGALLDIARVESGVQSVRVDTVDLCDLVHQAWKVYEQEALAKALSVRFQIGPALVECDRALLLPLVSNLLSNAVHHARSGGWVECRDVGDGDFHELTICNTCDNLSSDDLPYLFEPFWRKDASRSSNVHAGLGMSLVSAYAAALGIPVRAALPTPDVFQISITLRAAASEKMQCETADQA